MHEGISSSKWKRQRPSLTSLKFRNVLLARDSVSTSDATASRLSFIYLALFIGVIAAVVWQNSFRLKGPRHKSCPSGALRCQDPRTLTFLEPSSLAPRAVAALESVRVASLSPPVNGTALAGPLCVFVPTTSAFDATQDAEHRNETIAFLESWADNSTVLFSDSLDHLASGIGPNATFRALAQMKGWIEWHTGVIVERPALRRRGATADSIRGRGQLSIPLFHWISQLVKRNDPLVQNCKWFMKCDTDTYLRRGLLEREVLDKLNHTLPFQVGVPVHFNTRPFHHTPRNIEFDYNIGGPGYTFSRGLMAAVDTDECLKSMALDPVLLIHDDVATGYCAGTFVPSPVQVTIQNYVASSSYRVVTQLLSAPPQSTSAEVTSESTSSPLSPLWNALDRFRRRRAPAYDAAQLNELLSHGPIRLRDDLNCIALTVAIHPAEPLVMRLLAEYDRQARVVSTPTSFNCTVKWIAGLSIAVGDQWSLDPYMDAVARHWLVLWEQRNRRSHGFKIKNEVAAVDEDFKLATAVFNALFP